MGGYGGTSKRSKDKDGCYYDSGKFKVTDKNAMEAAEYYMSLGMYVVFLGGFGRPDLLVEFSLIVEVKGITSTNPSQVSKQIKKANKQINTERSKYPEDQRFPGKIVLISRHDSFEVGFSAINGGYQEAKRKGDVDFTVEFWFQGEIHILK